MPHKLEPKDERHTIFGDWLIATFGLPLLQSGGGVVDIAGGKGRLSKCLAERGVFCTIVDPVSLSNEVCMLRGAGRVSHIRSVLRAEEDAVQGDPVEAALAAASVVVGLHPDQATETLVRRSLLLGKPFAVIPCCTYRGLFPGRRLISGQGVRSYSGLCAYLREIDAHIRVIQLPFAGRNACLYSNALLTEETITEEPLL